MKIIIVRFRAYDKPHEKFFLNKTFFQIHTELHEICETYEPTSIMEVTKTEFLPLVRLQNFKATEPTTAV